MIISLTLSLFIGASATGCTDSNGAEPNSSIRVETAEVTAITSDNALSGGRVIGETETVTEFGICWATTDNPTMSDSHNTGAGDANSFACYVTGLSASTTYYVRAYATTRPERFTVSPANLRRLPVRMTIRLLPMGMTSRIRWLRPSICGRRAIWRK